MASQSPWPAEVYINDGNGNWVSIAPHGTGVTVIPVASPTVVGGIKVGSNLIISADGTLTAEFSGNYNDLTNKPTITQPEQSDWLSTGGLPFIRNKPTQLSQFSNDMNFVDAAGATAASKIQEIKAGTNIVIDEQTAGVFIISSTGGGGGGGGGTVTKVEGVLPVVVASGSTIPQISVNVSSETTYGTVRLASTVDVNSATVGAVIDASKLKVLSDGLQADIDSNSADITNILNATVQLPISSADGTVTLKSDTADTFAVSTAGKEQVIVDGNGHVGVGASPRSNVMLDVVGDTSSAFLSILKNRQTAMYDGRAGIRIENSANGTFMMEIATDPTTKTYGFSGGSSGGSQAIIGGSLYMDIEVLPQSWVKIRDELRVNAITTVAGVASDAKIELDANLAVSTGAFYLNVGNPAKNITIGSNTSNVAGGDGVYLMSRTFDMALSANDIRFNSNWSGGANIDSWVMNTTGNFVAHNNLNTIQCNNYTSAAGISTDASIELSTNFVVSTGGAEVARFGPSYFRCSSAAGNYFYAEQVGNYQAIWIGGKGGSGGSGNVGIQTARVTGTDKDGRSMTIAAGHSTGSGLPGELVFATSDVGASGSTENDLTTRLKIDNANRVLVNAAQAPLGLPPTVFYVNCSAIFNTDVKTPSVSGVVPNAASIVIGAELLTTNHTPTQPNSIATKAYVDANAGSTDLSAYSTTVQMELAISGHLTPYSTTAQMDTAIAAAIPAPTDLSAYSTTVQADSATAAALTPYSTTVQMNAAINNATGGIVSNLPLSSADSSVTLESGAQDVFSIVTAGTKKIEVTSVGNLVISKDVDAVTPDPSHDVHIVNRDRATLALHQTNEGRGQGANFEFMTGDKKWSMFHAGAGLGIPNAHSFRICYEPDAVGSNNAFEILTSGDVEFAAAADISVSATYTPTTDQSLVNKKYVDDNSGGIIDQAQLEAAVDAYLGGSPTTIVLPPDTDPNTAEPSVLGVGIGAQGGSSIGDGKIIAYKNADQIPARATEMVIQFREQGTTDWFLGTTAYIAAAVNIWTN